MNSFHHFAGFALVLAMSLPVMAQQNPAPATDAKTALGLEDGTLNFETPDFTLKLVKDSQTVSALLPKGANGFDFAPSDRLEKRAANGFNHLGDHHVSRAQGQSRSVARLRDFCSAQARRQFARPNWRFGDCRFIADFARKLPAAKLRAVGWSKTENWRCVSTSKTSPISQ